VIVELARWREPREILRLRSASGEIGAAEGPLSFRFYSTPQQADDLWYFRRTYSPFQLRWGGGELTFRGEGALPASGVERRALAEWSRAVASEMAGEGSERSFGLVFAWHGGGAVPCEDVSVSLAGTVWAEACPWGGAVRARLAPAQLPRLYAWFDSLAAFQETPGGETGDPERMTRLVFAGRGKRAATLAERQEIEAFGLDLARELRVRRPLAAGVAPVETSAGSEKGPNAGSGIGSSIRSNAGSNSGLKDGPNAEPAASAYLLSSDLSSGGHPSAILLTPPAVAPIPPARVEPEGESGRAVVGGETPDPSGIL
jgi:hypothetical protein